MTYLTENDIDYYLDRIRAFSLEALLKNVHDQDDQVDLFFINLCAAALEGDDSATGILKEHGISPFGEQHP